eukprot:4925122-Amphidinium_carterae.1
MERACLFYVLVSKVLATALRGCWWLRESSAVSVQEVFKLTSWSPCACTRCLDIFVSPVLVTWAFELMRGLQHNGPNSSSAPPSLIPLIKSFGHGASDRARSKLATPGRLMTMARMFIRLGSLRVLSVPVLDGTTAAVA